MCQPEHQPAIATSSVLYVLKQRPGFDMTNPVICRPLLTLLESEISEVRPEDHTNISVTASIQSMEQITTFNKGSVSSRVSRYDEQLQ